MQRIGVDEALAQPIAELHSDRRLAGSGDADHDDVTGPVVSFGHAGRQFRTTPCGR